MVSPAGPVVQSPHSTAQLQAEAAALSGRPSSIPGLHDYPQSCQQGSEADPEISYLFMPTLLCWPFFNI